MDGYVVDMQFKDLDFPGMGINHKDFGSNVYYQESTGLFHWLGVNWSKLDKDSVYVYRRSEDDSADEVRVRLWKNPQPDYDSKWVSLEEMN